MSNTNASFIAGAITMAVFLTVVFALVKLIWQQDISWYIVAAPICLPCIAGGITVALVFVGELIKACIRPE